MAVVSKRSRSDDPASIDGIDEAVLQAMYRAMMLTRSIEERGHSLYRQGRIPGSFYTGRGNEAAAVGAAWAMAPQDVGCPTQRDLGVHIVRGMAPWRIIAQYLGRTGGPTRGRDGNVHLGDVGLGRRRWSRTSRPCCRWRSAARSPSACARSRASRWAGSATADRRAETRTRR